MADWQTRPPACLPAHTSDWLVRTSSLTQALSAQGNFRVQCLNQTHALPTHDEWRVLGLPRRIKVWQREVLLLLNEVPVVYAHTVVPGYCTAADWPFFAHLGNHSLGSALYADPLILRHPRSYARLGRHHPLLQAARQTMRQYKSLHSDGSSFTRAWARRTCFTRRAACMLVTEIFLPTLFQEREPHAFTK